MQRCNIPLRDAVKMATKTPAEIMGLKNKGRIEAGYDADCLLLNEDLTPIFIMKNGKIEDEGTREHILHETENEYTKSLLNAVPSVGGERFV